MMIEVQGHLPHLGGVGANGVAENVVGRKTHREQIGGRASAHVLIADQLPADLKFVLVSEGGTPDDLVKSGVVPFAAFAMSSGMQHFTLIVFPLAIPVFRGGAGIEL